ncbi:MAG: FAD-linked oxidase [Caulobacter sp.]|nr:FAD-linked oxidase [Caulobacter sp.]
MRRRDLLGCAAALALAPSLSAAAGQPFRRVRPGDAAWPDARQWAGLKRQVGGRLVKPAPLWANCEQPATSQACLADLKNLLNPYYLGDQPGGTQVSGWLGAWTPQLSAYAVAARDAEDVAAAVSFARRHRLRLVVKGGGHSYQGTSNAPDSLLVWTRTMRAITLHDAFTPRGSHAAPVPAVTVEAGALWMDVYDAVTTKAGRYVQGGGCATVGVAGLIQSGGFGSFSKRFGLAAAGLLEAQIVTADGVIRTVNATREPELFWALKGGGGGSLGVVTRLTLKTHDLPERFGWGGGTIEANSDAAFARLIRRFVDHYAEALFNPHWGESVSLKPRNVLDISMVCQGLTNDEAQAAWKPFSDWVAAAPHDYKVIDEIGAGTMPARSWWDVQGRKAKGSTAVLLDNRPGAEPAHGWWAGDQDQVSAFLHGYESVWLPADLLEPGRRQALADALFAASRQMDVGLHFNKGLAGAPPDAIAAALDTATNPVVTTAFALAIIATGSTPPLPGFPGPKPDMAKAHANAARIDAATAALKVVAPVPGSYLSESNYFNPQWRDAYWGGHYPRLKAAKARYDPQGLFIIHHGVGSDQWSADGFTRMG